MRRFVAGFGIIVLAGLASGAAVSGHRAAPKQQAYEASQVNDPSAMPTLADGAMGSAVVRAQILLDRAHFSVGQIDGRIGANMEGALDGFRMAHGLPAGSGLDDTVWQALNQDQGPALVPYTISAGDLQGPFVKVPTDLMAQAKLRTLGYASPLDELSERFHFSPALARRLNPGKQFDVAGEQILVPNVSSPISGEAAKIVVSKSKSTVTAYDASGAVIAQYPCTSGSEHDPLPIGDWKVVGVAKNPKFHYNPNLFWDAKPGDAKATIAPGPRNPVGVVWIDLSKEHYGIHGTPDPGLVGHTQSHGCIRLTNWDAWQLSTLIKPGTPVSLVE